MGWHCFWGGTALLGVAAFLPDPTFCKQPKNHFGQIFGCLQNVGSGNNAATVNSATPKTLPSKAELTQIDILIHKPA